MIEIEENTRTEVTNKLDNENCGPVKGVPIAMNIVEDDWIFSLYYMYV